ncbi:A alpha-helical domain with a conserved ER moti [Microvirga vignae]|uniref:A alpha-helical domain with a conserved ER moti n=1 Tax=Microvirga vignae TaxID=1225564 RepID=A0A0H1RHC0_9HYPH|nr:alpha-E domain-containing protein [Microvirga vignae]KLK91992.1 A alpha-helical domain with a conserved ER moti [Microvirga vignae]
MLSRDADSLYWLSRYVERAENTARILDVAYRMASMPISYSEADTNEWESALITACGIDQFRALNGEVTPERVIEFLAFSEENPSSIQSCFNTARQNARSVRSALTSEMWEAINSAWLDLRRYSTKKIDVEELPRFLNLVKEASLRYDGSAMRTMLRNDAYWFSRLGVYIERADNTARVLDVKYHVLLPQDAEVGGGIDYYQWAAILRSVSALVSYQWVYHQNLRPWLVADLLILREEMPRSLAACYGALSRHLDDIAHRYGLSGSAQRQARSIHARLVNRNIEDIFQHGLHEFLHEFLAENNRLGLAITQQYLG